MAEQRLEVHSPLQAPFEAEERNGSLPRKSPEPTSPEAAAVAAAAAAAATGE